eukprot:2663031-Amphidinium_carterae.1
MVWFWCLVLPSWCGWKCKHLTCQGTRFGWMVVAVLPTTHPFVFARGPLTGPAQSVYRAELLALVTALQGAEPGVLVVSDCKSACRVVSRLWDGSRKPVGPHRDLELRLLSFTRLGWEVKWVKVHTDGLTAAQHGVSELDRRGNAQADHAAQHVLPGVDCKQETWKRYRLFACVFRNFFGAIGPALCERQEKLQVRPRLPHEDAPIEEMEWPFLFMGHTLERELE